MSGKKRSGVTRRRLLRGAGFVGAATLAGCSGLDGGPEPNPPTGTGETTEPTTATTGATTEAASGGVLRLGLSARADGYDPRTLSVGRGNFLLGHVYQALYAYDESTGLIPMLAAGEPEVGDDGTTYRVELAENARFQTGDAVTAGDAKRSIEAVISRADGGPSGVVDSIEAPDERTVTVSLAEPYAPLPHVLAAAPVVPGGDLPAAGATGAGTTGEGTTGDGSGDGNGDGGGTPAGSGPFRIAERTGDAVRLERWDGYWGTPKPALSGARFRSVPEPTHRLNTLKAGRNDVIEEDHPSIWRQVALIDRARLVATPGLRYFYLGFNCRAGPTADPTVREAIDYATSLDEAVADFVEPTGTRLYSPLPIPLAEDWGMPVDEWAEIPHEKDVERAKELLGGTDTVPADWAPRIIAPETRTYERLAIAVANGLGELGYEPTIRHLGGDEFAGAHVSGDAEVYDLFLSEWTGIPDPHAFTYPLFVPAAEGSTNGVHYRNDTVTQKLERARRASDRETRATLYEEAITTVLEDRVHLPIYTRKRGFGVRRYVTDFLAHPVTGFSLVSGYNNVRMRES